MEAKWKNVLQTFAAVGLPARRVPALTEAGSAARRLEDRERKRIGLVAAVAIEPDGERFVLAPAGRAEPRVLDGDRGRRHLLLHLRRGALERRILFGHDERHLFWSILPGGERADQLDAAFTALAPRTPSPVRENTGGGAGLSPVRQGEWFFFPEPDFVPAAWMLLQTGRLSRARRGRGRRPHLADEAAELFDDQGHRHLYVRGAVRHRDHSTLMLSGWHRVVLNREEGKGSVPAAGSWRFRVD